MNEDILELGESAEVTLTAEDMIDPSMQDDVYNDFAKMMAEDGSGDFGLTDKQSEELEELTNEFKDVADELKTKEEEEKESSDDELIDYFSNLSDDSVILVDEDGSKITKSELLAKSKVSQEVLEAQESLNKLGEHSAMLEAKFEELFQKPLIECDKTLKAIEQRESVCTDGAELLRLREIKKEALARKKVIDEDFSQWKHHREQEKIELAHNQLSAIDRNMSTKYGNWNEVRDSVGSYACQSIGVSPVDFATRFMNTGVAEMAYKAMMYDNHLSKSKDLVDSMTNKEDKVKERAINRSRSSKLEKKEPSKTMPIPSGMSDAASAFMMLED